METIVSLFHFNPTLVRLRRASSSSTTGGSGRFQSHAGSIEAPSEAGSRPKERSISIPRWFD